jgi:N-methylhydantoinase B
MRKAIWFSLMKSADPITLEVVKNALSSIADEMALVILRTAYSSIVRDSMDYSTGLCDRNGRVIAHGLTMALHLGAFPDAMHALIRDFGGDMHEGDIFVFNDPYVAGGMHLPDVYIVKPVVVAGELEGYACTLVHQIDMGGIAPGSTAVYATEIYQEGLRIPPVKMYERGKPNDTFFRIMQLNTRIPDKLAGDMRAQIAACNSAERSFRALVERYGGGAFRGMLEELHDYAERLTRAEIAALPDGTWSFTDYIDGLGDEPEPIALKATVTIAGDQLTVDWTGSSPQVKGAINCPSPFVKSAVHLMVKCIARQEIPNFEGYLRPLSMILPEGTIVNPVAPAACAARAIVGWRAIDTLMGVFAQIAPERIGAAGEGGVTFPAFSGWHNGQRYVLAETLAGSWGAMRDADGVFGIPNPGGNLTNQPVEMIEALYPIEIEAYGMLENSGGPGKYRGAPGILRRYRMLGAETTIVMRADRQRYLPWGLDGGAPGTPSYHLVKANGSQRILPQNPMYALRLTQGETFVHIGAGGAGVGDALERDAARVLEDVREERISADYARDVYGVAMADGKVDEAATRKLREALRRSRDPQRPKYLQYFLAPLGVRDYRLEGERNLSAR